MFSFELLVLYDFFSKASQYIFGGWKQVCLKMCLEIILVPGVNCACVKKRRKFVADLKKSYCKPSSVGMSLQSRPFGRNRFRGGRNVF